MARGLGIYLIREHREAPDLHKVSMLSALAPPDIY
jgi:hypothetical protein